VEIIPEQKRRKTMADKGLNPCLIEEVWGAAAIAGSIVLSPVLRSWYSKWGASEEETKMTIPGDELVPRPRLETTRAITVQAPASAIWPWLVQMGQGRGGLYSYQRLENLIGCDIHNADRILPEHQNLKVGDKVHLTPQEDPAFYVTAIVPDSILVLRGDIPSAQGKPTTWIWIFRLNPIDESITRLILRSRLDYALSFVNTLMWRVLTDPIAFNLERKMLQGIKARAEAIASD
jgi:hypothetical protein